MSARKTKRLSTQVTLGRKVVSDEPVIVHPGPAWRKYAKEHAAYEFIGIVSCGPQVGALAKMEDGSYVQLNGEWVTPLEARDVQAALRRAGATVASARPASGPPPPRLFGKLSERKAPRSGERRSERSSQRQDESAASLAQTNRRTELSAEARQPVQHAAPQVPATTTPTGVTVVLKKTRKRTAVAPDAALVES